MSTHPEEHQKVPTESANPAPIVVTSTMATPSGYISNPIDLIKPSWNTLKLNLGSYIASAMIQTASILLVIATVVFGSFATGFPGSNNLVGIAASILTILAIFVVVAFVPVTTIILLHSARGQKVSLMQAFKEGNKFIAPFMGVSILSSLAILAGFILLVIPGLIFFAWFILSTLVMVDEKLGVVASMKRSKELASGHVVEMLGVMFLVSAAGIVADIPIIGGVVSLISLVLGFVYAAALPIRYLQLKALQVSGQPKSAVHIMNYVVIVLAVVSFALQSRSFTSFIHY